MEQKLLDEMLLKMERGEFPHRNKLTEEEKDVVVALHKARLVKQYVVGRGEDGTIWLRFPEVDCLTDAGHARVAELSK